MLNPVLHGSFSFTNFQFSELKGYSLQIVQAHYFGEKSRMSLSETKLAGTHIWFEGILQQNED